MSKHKKFVYMVNEKTKQHECTFTGEWSKGDVERMHRNTMKELRKYKHDLRRRDENERAKSEPKSDPGGASST